MSLTGRIDLMSLMYLNKLELPPENPKPINPIIVAKITIKSKMFHGLLQ